MKAASNTAEGTKAIGSGEATAGLTVPTDIA